MFCAGSGGRGLEHTWVPWKLLHTKKLEGFFSEQRWFGSTESQTVQGDTWIKILCSNLVPEAYLDWSSLKDIEVADRCEG